MFFAPFKIEAPMNLGVGCIFIKVSGVTAVNLELTVLLMWQTYIIILELWAPSSTVGRLFLIWQPKERIRSFRLICQWCYSQWCYFTLCYHVLNQWEKLTSFFKHFFTFIRLPSICVVNQAKKNLFRHNWFFKFFWTEILRLVKNDSYTS